VWVWMWTWARECVCFAQSDVNVWVPLGVGCVDVGVGVSRARSCRRAKIYSHDKESEGRKMEGVGERRYTHMTNRPSGSPAHADSCAHVYT
jgi:hypothetical protein